MNTNQLKKFAQEARRELLKQVSNRLDFVLKGDTPELREKAEQVQKLKKVLDEQGRVQLIDKVAYTWFNRLVALRFMDVNDYQPLGIRVITPQDGFTIPELLQEARQGHIPSELPGDKDRIAKLISGSIPSSDPQNEAYRLLFLAACNHLNRVFPFLFESINDWMELLLPDDLISELSVLELVRNGMTIEDCQEVEIIGWLYQFYISELNDELISSKKKYSKNELAPASQLFTPKWIVQYMVDNTLGQLWSEIDPNSKVMSTLDYYIKPAYKDGVPDRPKKSIEDVKFFEPCVGSGHILSYAFDVFYKIYEEQGYNSSEIPELIISKNLFGVDIDERAAQLAAFVLFMKARDKYRRFFRAVEKSGLKPNITFYQDFEFDNKFNNSTALGSLVHVEEGETFKVDHDSLFGQRQEEVLLLYKLLGQRYDVVVTNPPYISSSRMEGTLKQYVEKNYPETKSDLFATFILRCLELCNDKGLTGYMTPFVWMFISSYQKLREKLIDKHFINNLIQLEYSGFDGATVPICTFTLRKQSIPESKGSYIRLSDFRGAKVQGPKTLEAIQNPDCGWFFHKTQSQFSRIPYSPIAYDLTDEYIELFGHHDSIRDHASPRKGMVTANNPRFIRYWFEPNPESVNYGCSSRGESIKSGKKWFPYAKGGSFRRWDGNVVHVINWHNDGKELLGLKDEGYKVGSTNHNFDFIFKPAIVWTKITSEKQSFRLVEKGHLFDDASGLCPVKIENDIYYILGILNSLVAQNILEYLNPTLNLQPGNIASLPLATANDSKDIIDSIVKECLTLSKQVWDSQETSYNYSGNPLLEFNCSIKDAVNSWGEELLKKAGRLEHLENELQSLIYSIYSIPADQRRQIPKSDISLSSHVFLADSKTFEFDPSSFVYDLVSAFVGHLFGRFNNVEFAIDEDNVVPILADEWFSDDVAGEFRKFLKTALKEEQFTENIEFIEKCIGKDIRTYFLRDFYDDHIRRYSKRPIYWMFSSERGAFNVLIYMHRYTPDTLNIILNDYLRPFIDKLKNRVSQLEHIEQTGEGKEKTRAIKEMDKLKLQIKECEEYEREVLYPLASKRIEIDLDDGVLVNYNKFGKAVKEVKGLNDKKTKEKVRKFDWIDGTEII